MRASILPMKLRLMVNACGKPILMETATKVILTKERYSYLKNSLNRWPFFSFPSYVTTDSYQTTLLVAWLRVGFWLRPASKQHFTFRAAKNELDILGVKIEPNEEVLGIARLINGKVQQIHGDTTALYKLIEVSDVLFQVDAIVTLNTDSGFPHRLFVTTYGEYEEWELTKWQQLLVRHVALFDWIMANLSLSFIHVIGFATVFPRANPTKK